MVKKRWSNGLVIYVFFSPVFIPLPILFELRYAMPDNHPPGQERESNNLPPSVPETAAPCACAFWYSIIYLWTPHTWITPAETCLAIPEDALALAGGHSSGHLHDRSIATSSPAHQKFLLSSYYKKEKEGENAEAG